MTKNYAKVPTSWIVQEIEANQEIQKKNGPDSEVGKIASRAMAPLFKVMQERQKDNNGETDWRKWKWVV